MRILIMAAGSYGDVAPYTGLGVRLRDAGHEVALAAPETFAALVTGCGLDFRPLPADPRTRSAGGGGSLMGRAAAFVQQLARGVAEAAAPGADLLLLSTTTDPLGLHVAEALAIPSLGVYLQPVAPTRAFPPVVGARRSLGGRGNRAAGKLGLRVVDRLHADAVRQLRARLDLPALGPRAARRRQEAAGRRILHGFSPTVVPRPADWRAGLDVVGNWWPHVPADRTLPVELEDFLRAGPPPVFLGFGSMAGSAGERISELAAEALRLAGVRGVVQAGWAELSVSGADLLTIGEVPHALLFPRTAAVVHHAGAGTAAAGLRSGVPAVPVPVTADQPFWARRLTELGAATAPIPFRELTAERLADAIRRVLADPSCRRRAAEVAALLAAEDGAARVIEAVSAHAR
ncbi:glycosyltransferase [Streptomyces paludis]|uniref:Glycosyltransferase n=1 Tax=Streptomyces paludis TaxID=2282738 RepID=A0A345HWK5_9ACTN|nr:glycosyltransferase [Streptomyces paludis]AXG81079.1 glycosyltransferase [Streptomyces paludis]